MTRPRPNILFITADQWRGDCLGLAGHEVVQTPNVDALAAGGTAFLRHYSAAAPCSPARAAIYTGLYQMNNRVVANGAPLDDRFDNMARAARRAGYRPTLFGYTDTSPDPRRLDPADPALRTYEGVLPGFEVEQALLGDPLPWQIWLREQGYDEDVARDPFRPQPEPGHKVSRAPARFAPEHSQTAFLVGRVIDWLGNQAEDAPWFAHLSLIHPHPPLVAPAPYHDMYAPEDGPAFKAATPDVMDHPVVRSMAGQNARGFVPGTEGSVEDLCEDDKRRLRCVYFGLISEVDAQLGRLFAALKAQGQWDNTLVIVTSDHAEMMGDYGLMGKGGFFPESQHIPLVMHGPGVVAGQVCTGFTSATDLFPTMLGAWGGQARNTLDGVDLGPVLRGETAETGRDCGLWEFDFREALSPGERQAGRGGHLQAMLDETALYVAIPGEAPLLFDLEEGPGPLANCADDPGHQAARLAAAERLLTQRQRANDETLADVRLGRDGARHLTGGPIW